MGSSGAPRPRSAAPVADRWPPGGPALGWWALHAATLAGWALGGCFVAYAAGVFTIRGDGEFTGYVTLLAMAAVVVGAIVGAIGVCRSRGAAALGVAAGILLASSLPVPAGLGLLGGPLGIASPLVAAVTAAAALAYAHWRATESAPEEEPENRAFAPPGERRRILRRRRRRR